MLTLESDQVMDAFDMPAVLRLQTKIGRKFNKVFIDINGSRDIGTVCDCMDKYQKVPHHKTLTPKRSLLTCP